MNTVNTVNNLLLIIVSFIKLKIFKLYSDWPCLISMANIQYNQEEMAIYRYMLWLTLYDSKRTKNGMTTILIVT